MTQRFALLVVAVLVVLGSTALIKLGAVAFPSSLSAALPFSFDNPFITNPNTSADSGRIKGTPANAVGYVCYAQYAQSTDGVSAGLYLPPAGDGHVYAYDGVNNTSCLDVDFGATQQAQSVVVNYSNANSVCGDSCYGSYCSTDPGASLYISTDKTTWKRVSSLAYAAQTTAKTISLNSQPVRYARVCRGGGGSSRANVLVDSVTLVPTGTVEKPGCTLSASPANLNKGGSATLTWATQNASSLSIDQNIGNVSPVAGGTKSVNPAVTTTYTATVTSPAGSSTCAATVVVTDRGDATAPSVSFNTPAADSTVSNSVSVSASASDNVGVVGVLFKVDGVAVSAEDTSSPYATTWNTTVVRNGSHTLSAEARDAAGNTQTATRTVNVSNTYAAPSATPAPGVYSTSQSVSLSAPGASGIRYTTNGVSPTCSQGSIYDGPISVSRTATIMAIACYSSGQSSVASFAYSINQGDTVPPSVSITSPAGGTTVSTAVTVSASASDNVGVVGVQFKLDSENLGAEDASSPFATTWDASKASAGTHTLYAIARDAASNRATTSETVTVGGTSSGALELYMAPGGDDTRDGLSAATAVGTLTRIRAIIDAKKLNADITVHIARGTYRGQTISWNGHYLMPDHKITFLGDGDVTSKTDMPVFDGCLTDGNRSTCNTKYWFYLATDKTNLGKPTNIVIDHVRVQNYLTAIRLGGDGGGGGNGGGATDFFGTFLTAQQLADRVNAANSGNIVRNSFFFHIGYLYVNGSSMGTWYSPSVISMPDSHDNQIVNNRFETSRNAADTEGHNNIYLHGIYLSHSSNNLISGNTFYDIAGDSIRFRNESNNNTLANNTFLKTGMRSGNGYTGAAVEEWIDVSTGECPSQGNTATNNTFSGGLSCASPAVAFSAVQSNAAACGMSAAQRAANLVYVSGTTYDYAHCSSRTASAATPAALASADESSTSLMANVFSAAKSAGQSLGQAFGRLFGR